jgi:hypothetical protein
LVPTSDGSDDCGSPGEGLRIIVGLPQKVVDGGLKIDNRSEHAAFEAAIAEFCKEALDGIEPRA